MSAEPLEALLDQLCHGDAAAAEQVFRTYEPYLRKVVRRKLPVALRAKFDSLDVVQSIWADLLDGFRDAGWRFADANHLRAFLVKVTRNRFIDRCRRYQTALDRERPLSTHPERLPASPLPRPSEVAQADDLWEQLLALCPPAHHDLLRLKRQGLPLPEIAARTGLHPASVRRILRELAQRLDARQAPPSSSAGSSAHPV
jgi:RNA polymerase sigma-70 factor (ECF subfamily)